MSWLPLTCQRKGFLYLVELMGVGREERGLWLSWILTFDIFMIILCEKMFICKFWVGEMIFHQGWVPLEKVLRTPMVELKTKTRNVLKCIGGINSSAVWKLITEVLEHYSQWRIWGMAGMARAIGATLMGGHKKCLAKIKILMHSFLNIFLRPMSGTEQG